PHLYPLSLHDALPIYRTGRFEPAALARTIAVIERYCRRARALAAETIRVGATSATRDAANRDELADAVRRSAGSELEVITGEREDRKSTRLNSSHRTI